MKTMMDKLWGLLRTHPWRVASGLFIGIAIGYGIHAFGDQWSREDVVSFGRRVPAWILLPSFLILPLLGLPISLFLLLIGLRFGFWWGLALSTAAMYFHTFAAYRIAHGLFRRRVRRWLVKKQFGLPTIKVRHQGWFTVLFAAIHGPPYFVKLYALALTDIPLRIHLLYGAPTYIVFAIPPLAFGNAFAQLGLGWMFAILGLGVLTVLIGRWIRNRQADPQED
jgi:uncharacterized membrane protein YdjX (TVP38/TMEM64 family)